jgi:predicted phosphodiesterase
MTRVALLADIHANAVALERVLDDLSGADTPDHFVCLGDVAATGAQPAEAVALLRGLGADVVMGNADAYILDPEPSGDDEFMRKIEDIDRWCRSQLTAQDLEFIASFRPTVTLALPGATLLAYHGSPSSYDDVIDANTSDDDLAQMLDGYDATLFAGGHTHFSLVRRLGASYVLNPGSVGLAYDRSRPIDAITLAPWAEYAVLEVSERGLSIELRRVAFDVDAYVDAMVSSDMPHARWQAGEYRRSS